MKNTQNTLQNKIENNSLDWDLEAILEGKPFDDLYARYAHARDNVIAAYKNGNCYAKLESFRAYTEACDAYGILSNRL